MDINKFNVDLSTRIKAYTDNMLKENKFTDVVGNVNRSTRGGELKTSKFVMPNGNIAPPDNFTIRGTLNVKGGKIDRLNKAERWRDFSGDTVGIGLDLGDKALTIKAKHDPRVQAMNSAKQILGGKVNRLKKAEQWRDFSADTVNQGLDLGDKALTIKDNHDPRSKAQASLSKALGGGKLPSKARISAAIKKLDAIDSGSKVKLTKLQYELLQKIGVLESQAGGCMPKIPPRQKPTIKATVAGGSTKKAPGAWVMHVKDYAKKNNVSYKVAMQEAAKTYKK
jgi:hypothetical protein